MVLFITYPQFYHLTSKSDNGILSLVRLE